MVWNSRLSRRSTLVGAALAGAGALVGGTASKAQALPNVDIVVSGVRKALIVKPAGALSPELTAAIQDLTTYVQRSTGVTLPSLTQAQLDASGTTYDGDARIYVHFVGVEGDPALPAVVAGLAADGFAIATYGNTLSILGPTDAGTRFGVSEFLERFVGVRWLMPTDLGDDVPTLTTLSIPPTSITQEPVFLSRNLGGIPYGPDAAGKSRWLARNRNNPRITFSHALHAIFNPFTYADPNKSTYRPEYYPMRNGVRFLPSYTTITNYQQTGWQPTFTEPSTVDRAVEYALQKFTDPKVLSISLGVNDSQGFSDLDPDDPSGINSQNVMGKSEVYFTWVNAVAAEVAQTYPDRLIGCLAYNATADPPSFPLEPNVVPFLTRDRYGWVDSTIETSEKQRQTAWEAVANKVGWYDYMYGTPYVIPRVYPHLLDEVYAYGLSHSTIGAYAEVYPNWGEGPKPWVHLKKLWNPALDVDTLLTDWYQRAVGSSAAPYLAQYYTLFENFWMQNVPSIEWFQSRRTFNYFNFADPHYVASLPATLIDDAADLMDTVVSLAPNNTPYKARAEKLHRAFEYYEASVKSYPRNVAGPTTSTAALAIINQLAPALEAYEKRADLQEEFKTDALLYQHITAPSWFYWTASHFWTIVDYLRIHEPSGGSVTTRLTDDSTSSIHLEIRDFANTVLSVAGGAAPLLSNYSFETASGTDGAADWNRWVTSTGTLTRSTLQARGGTASIKASALRRGGPHRSISINPGLLALRTYVFASGSASSWHGTFQYSVALQSGAGATLTTKLSRPVPVSILAGAWRPIGGLFWIPEMVGTTPVEKINLVLVLDGFQNDPDFFLDDVLMHQAP